MIHCTPQLTTLGKTKGYYRPRYFGLCQSDRLFHTYIIGQTGTGKSSLLAKLARQDGVERRGYCLIDPHGDLANQIVVSENPPDLVWSPADPKCPLGYNPLSFVTPEYRPLLASGLIETLRKQWSDSWGVRMEHLLRFALLALLERPGSTLADLAPLFLHRSFREEVLSYVTDEQTKQFWQIEYPVMNYRSSADGFAPIANKIGAFLAHPLVRKAICTPDQPLRFRQIMDQRQSIVVNLSKGKLGADVANVLGGLIITSLANAAYTRESVAEQARVPFILYVDEFHSFTSAAIAEMLSELRKYKLGMVLAAQYTAQTEPAVLEAIIGNVGTFICFRLGATDAAKLAKHMATPEINPRDLANLPNHEMYVRMMVDGNQTKAFSARTLL